MAAPSTTSAQAPEAEHSQMGLNEPSMEDILASIRRIIAEDQTNNLARGSIGGLTRRAALAAAAEARPVEDRQAPVVEPEAPAIEPPPPPYEPEIHADPLADAPAHGFEMPAEEPMAYHTDHPHAPEVPYEHEPEHPGFIGHDAGQEGSYALPEPLEAGMDAEPLMSPATGASITSSFHVLAETLVLQDPELIERVMRDSMRPLLKAWLDDHLPSIVERLVRTEIERVARGGRGRNG